MGRIRQRLKKYAGARAAAPLRPRDITPARAWRAARGEGPGAAGPQRLPRGDASASSSRIGAPPDGIAAPTERN